MGLKEALTPEARERLLKLAQKGKQENTESEGVVAPFPEEAWVGVFEEYRELVGPCTNAPDEYHWAILLLLIGLILGRQLYLENPNRLYANFYLLLIGPAGRNKKSTCLSFGERLAEAMGDKLRVIRHPSSLEGIFKVLAEREGSRALIFQDEFRGLLAASHRAATGNLLSGLNTLYACPPRDSLTRKETVSIEAPFVSLLTGAPQRWIEEVFEAGDFTGGFMSRVMVLGGRRKEPIPCAPAPEPQRLREFASELHSLAKDLPKEGHSMKWSEGAQKLWVPWFRAREAALDLSPEHESSLCVRLPDNVLKIAVIYSLIEGSKDLTQGAMAIAIKVGDYLQANTLQIFGGMAFTRAARLEQRLLKLVSAKEGVTRRELRKEIGGYYDSGEFNRALDNLCQAEQIEPCESGGSRGPAGRAYKVTKGGFE